jgi:hypothetical protein
MAPPPADDFNWLPDSKPEPAVADFGQLEPTISDATPLGAEGEFNWLNPAGGEPEPRPAEGNFMWSEAEAAVTPADPAADLTAGEPRPWQEDSIMKPPQREDFWTTPAPGPSDLQPPVTTPAPWAEPASLPGADSAVASAGTAVPPQAVESGPVAPGRAADELTVITTAGTAQGFGPAPTQGPVQLQGQAQRQNPLSPQHAAPAQGPGHVAVPQPHRSDRLFSAKLIVVIIIAALIGSALVLLLR